mmetsp:Transcript_1721/g.6361  ORF Transcript_1721/g.6361 Transcript_1721/m.6361 type:complete len:276 (-) Transcript_1721:746-1573(-)
MSPRVLSSATLVQGMCSIGTMRQWPWQALLLGEGSLRYDVCPIATTRWRGRLGFCRQRTQLCCCLSALWKAWTCLCLAASSSLMPPPLPPLRFLPRSWVLPRTPRAPSLSYSSSTPRCSGLKFFLFEMCDPIRSSAAAASPLLSSLTRSASSAPSSSAKYDSLAPSSPWDLNFWPPWGPLAQRGTDDDEISLPSRVTEGSRISFGPETERAAPAAPGFAAAASLALSRSAAVLGSPLDAAAIEGWGDPVVAGSPVDAGGWACGWDFRGRHDRLSL